MLLDGKGKRCFLSPLACLCWQRRLVSYFRLPVLGWRCPGAVIQVGDVSLGLAADVIGSGGKTQFSFPVGMFVLAATPSKLFLARRHGPVLSGGCRTGWGCKFRVGS